MTIICLLAQVHAYVHVPFLPAILFQFGNLLSNLNFSNPILLHETRSLAAPLVHFHGDLINLVY